MRGRMESIGGWFEIRGQEAGGVIFVSLPTQSSLPNLRGVGDEDAHVWKSTRVESTTSRSIYGQGNGLRRRTR